MVPLSFADHEMRLVHGRALFWPREQALLVADLHLEKASFFAQRGQMLPPYDSRETLERVALALRETGARRVFCLGDNFHDSAGAARLEPHAAGMLAALVRVVDWVWITGNHDAELSDPLGGTLAAELTVGGVALRHRALNGAPGPELSGHFHPKLTVQARGRRIARPCAVRSEARMILPAFGTLTGGMNAAAPEILAALQPARAIDALVPLGSGAEGRLAAFPLWRAAH
ncbi:MAG TPA: ligase-associated DNA damage response endonuclease PdeM [Novosphingobium sp.]